MNKNTLAIALAALLVGGVAVAAFQSNKQPAAPATDAAQALPVEGGLPGPQQTVAHVQCAAGVGDGHAAVDNEVADARENARGEEQPDEGEEAEDREDECAGLLRGVDALLECGRAEGDRFWGGELGCITYAVFEAGALAAQRQPQRGDEQFEGVHLLQSRVPDPRFHHPRRCARGAHLRARPPRTPRARRDRASLTARLAVVPVQRRVTRAGLLTRAGLVVLPGR